MVKRLVCGPGRDHGTRKSVFCLMQFFQERNGDMHRFAGANLLCEFCTIARLDKLMRARRLAFTDVPETEMNKNETAIHVHFCG